MPTFKTTAIHNLLKKHSLEPAGDETGQPACDVVYALFLEPRSEPDPRWTTAECLIDKAVRTFQPSPALSHCELLIPLVPFNEELRSQFATYIGRLSGWQTDKLDGINYYLVENAGRWRAVPVFQASAAALLREECDKELGVPYSLARYLTAVPPLRWAAGLVSDKRRAPAHCATLLARVLRNAGVYTPVKPSATYGPSTLYHELCKQAAWKGERMGAGAWEGMPVQTAMHVDQLVRGVMDPATVDDVGDEDCLCAVQALTMRACNALVSSDAMVQRLTQQQLATTLLRWTILRDLAHPKATELVGVDVEE